MGTAAPGVYSPMRPFTATAALGSLLLLTAPASAQVELPRRQGDYELEVSGLLTETTRIVVRGHGRVVARIDPNPGGRVSGSFTVGFTAGDNILASWGCGTYCTTSVLFTLTGTDVVSFGIHEVSPARDLAVTFPAFDSPGYGDVVEVIDLRTGRVLRSVREPEAWNTCEVRWSPTEAVLVPCDGRTKAVVVRLPSTP